MIVPGTTIGIGMGFVDANQKMQLPFPLVYTIHILESKWLVCIYCL